MKSFKTFIKEAMLQQIEVSAGGFDDDQTAEDILLLTRNPTKAELERLIQFAHEYELDMEHFNAMWRGKDLRFVFDMERDDVYLWTGYRTHDNIIKKYNISKPVSGIANSRGLGLKLMVVDIGGKSLSRNKARKNQKLMSRISNVFTSNKIKTKME